MPIIQRKPTEVDLGNRVTATAKSSRREIFQRPNVPSRVRRRHAGKGFYCGVRPGVVTFVLVVVTMWLLGFVVIYLCIPETSRRKLPGSPFTSSQIPSAKTSNNEEEKQSTSQNLYTKAQKLKSRLEYQSGHHSNSRPFESPLLVITYNRTNYLDATLQRVLDTIPQPCGFGCPVIVSEDGAFESNKKLLISYKEKFETKGIPLVHIHHKKTHFFKQVTIQQNPSLAYKALAKHFGWAISQVFDGTAISLDPDQQKRHHPFPRRVVILEEDIRIAPDFFSYMESTSVLLDNDPTLFAVSAYNDNGHLEGGDPRRLLRSDFFPGLGWMITRNLWKDELESKWPQSYWDDWLRERDQRKDRQVIRPEVSRTFHIGKEGGTSGNQFGSILDRVKLNEEAIGWDIEDLSYLDSDMFQEEYTKKAMGSKLVNSYDSAMEALGSTNVKVEYANLVDFENIAARLDVMKDEKDSVPRTAYRGIVEVRYGSHFLFLVPKGGFHGYRKKDDIPQAASDISRTFNQVAPKKNFWSFLPHLWP